MRRQTEMRKNLSKMFFGIAVVAAGIIFLGSAFGFWEISELSGCSLLSPLSAA